jgi:hypothetical protein
VAAIKSLGRAYIDLSNKQARDVLLLACETDASPAVRSAALSELMQVEDVMQRQYVEDILNEVKERRASVRVQLEHLLEEHLTGRLSDPFAHREIETGRIVQDIIVVLRDSFQLEARTETRSIHDPRIWTRETDYGLTRLMIEEMLQKSIVSHVRDERQKAQMMGDCPRLVQQAIFDRFYVRPKPFGSILAKVQAWSDIRDSVAAVVRAFDQNGLIVGDFEATKYRANSAVNDLSHLIHRELSDDFVHGKEPALRQIVSSSRKFSSVIHLLEQEQSKTEPDPLLLRLLLRRIVKDSGPKWYGR